MPWAVNIYVFATLMMRAMIGFIKYAPIVYGTLFIYMIGRNFKKYSNIYIGSVLDLHVNDAQNAIYIFIYSTNPPQYINRNVHLHVNDA